VRQTRGKAPVLVFESAAFGGRICASKGEFIRIVLTLLLGHIQALKNKLRWDKLEVVKPRQFDY
jgi:hypothetical protein